MENQTASSSTPTPTTPTSTPVFPTNPSSVPEIVNKDIQELQERRAEALLVNGKNRAYISDRVFKYNRMWWDKWKMMMRSDDKEVYRTAVVEFNKLQQKILPTQFETSDGQGVVVNVLGYGIQNNLLPPSPTPSQQQSTSTSTSPTIIESDSNPETI